MATWEPGSTVADRLTIEGRLASGGMAQLYLAQMDAPGGVRRRVVAKRVHPHLAEDRDFVTMFFDEARVGSQLNHSGLVSVLDAIVEGTELILILEYVPGWDLGALLREARAQEAPPSWSLILSIVQDLAVTLQYVHQATDVDGRPLNIVHRDVTPANVLVTTDGSVRLLDFGVAKAASQVTRTATGIMKANPAYASPEQARGEPVDARTDLYTLGLVVYELLTLHRAIEGGDPLSRLANAARPSFPPPSWHRPEVPASLEQLTMNLLEQDPSRRPQGARAVEPLIASAVTEVGSPDRHAVRQWVIELVGSASRPLETGRTALDQALAGAVGLDGVAGTRAASRPGTPPNANGTLAFGEPSDPFVAHDAQTPTSEVSASVRPTARRWGPWVLLAGMAAAAVGVTTWSQPDLFESRPPPTAAPPSFGFVRVTTEPSGATALVDGEVVPNSTPTVARLSVGQRHRVEVELAGYSSQHQLVTPEPNETVSVDFVLEAERASLEVSSQPEGAAVRFGGRSLGRTPLRLDDLSPKAGTLIVTHPGYRPHRERIRLAADDPARVEVRLEPVRQMGTLAVSTRPWARVRVGSRVVAESTPATGIALPVGTHLVTLDNPRLGLRARRRVRIRPGQTTRLVVQLE